MDYTNNSMSLKSPRLLCVPARPLVCFFAILGIIGRLSLMITAPSFWVVIQHSFFLLLNLLLLFGALRNNKATLKFSLNVVLIGVILAIFQFLLWPVAYSSFAASGLGVNNTVEQSADSMEKYAEGTFGNETPKQHMFFLGLITGYAYEIGSLLLIGIQIIKYTLIHRLWVHAKTIEVGGNVYIAP